MSLTDEVKAFALEAGLDIARVTGAEPPGDAAARMRAVIGRGLYPGWRPEKMESFCSPRHFLGDARSVLVVGECCLTSERSSPDEKGSRGTIARYAQSNYYHDVRKKLGRVARFLRERKGAGFHFRCFSNGPLAEKPLALRSGLGWYGKHGIVLTEELGSWLVLGELVSSVELEGDEPLQRDCGDCRRCMDACPTGAIVEPYVLDERRCLQYITTRARALPPELRTVWGTRLYGCTACQDACPFNARVEPRGRWPEHGHVGPDVPLAPILEMDESEYRRRFSENQMGRPWVEFGAIQRNAAVALGNAGDEGAVDALAERLMRKGDVVVGAHCAWALGRIGGRNAMRALERALGMGLDSEVRAEVEEALRGAGVSARNYLIVD